MSLRTAAQAQRTGFAVLGVSVLSGIVLSALALVIVAFGIDPAPRRTATVASPRIAYLEFGSVEDTLWLADPSRPEQRRKVRGFDHGAEFGILPSRSPDGRVFAYTALPRGVVAPSPETPADLWLARFGPADPKRLAAGLDLLVRPVWTADAGALVFRRSRPQYGLYLIDLGSRRERALVSAPDALFPVAFAADGKLLFVRLQQAGSELYAVDTATRAVAFVARLSEGLTRDWSLSPGGGQFAFLALHFADGSVASSAHVLDLATRSLYDVLDDAGDELSPVWRQDGSLVVGRLARDGGAAVVWSMDGARQSLQGPSRGFDVPLAFSPADDLLVSTFDGASLTSPGRATLTLIDDEGRRRQVAGGDITVLGWVTP